MKERFEGDGRQNLIAAVERQEFTGGNPEIAEAFGERCVDPILSEQDAQGILLSWAMTEKQRHNVGVN